MGFATPPGGPGIARPVSFGEAELSLKWWMPVSVHDLSLILPTVEQMTSGQGTPPWLIYSALQPLKL